MSKKSDRLNDCLERLSQGEELESCLKDYPEEAEELRLLLETVSATKRHAEAVKLCPESIARTRYVLEKAYERKYFSRKAGIATKLRRMRSLAALAAVVILALIIIFTGGFSLCVMASEDTMPGQTLYPVKLATEQIRVAFTFSKEQKVSDLTRFAENRVGEIAYSYKKGDTGQVEAGMERLEGDLNSIENMYSRDNTSGAAASNSQSPEINRAEAIVQSSSARANLQLKKIAGPDPEKKEQIVSRVDQAYSKAVKAIKSANIVKTPKSAR